MGNLVGASHDAQASLERRPSMLGGFSETGSERERIIVPAGRCELEGERRDTGEGKREPTTSRLLVPLARAWDHEREVACLGWGIADALAEDPDDDS
jgi:hypothetical protein